MIILRNIMCLKKKKKLSRNYPRWRYRHDKPACKLLKTSQESCEWLIASRHGYRVLISSPLSPSHKECETNPSREKKNAAVFANRISWKKSLHSQKLPRWAQQIYVTKGKYPHSSCYKKYCMQDRNILTNLSPSPARSEKSGLTYNSAPRQKFHSMSSILYLHNDTKIYLRWNQNAQRWIGKKVPSFTFNTKRMSNKTRCGVLVKQMFRTWMKTLLHCGFG